MMRKFLCAFAVSLMTSAASWADGTLKIGGQTATPALLSDYGISTSMVTIGAVLCPQLTLRNTVISTEAAALEYSNTTAAPLVLNVSGICVLESTGAKGLLVQGQSVVVTGSGSLYVKGTSGVVLATQSAVTLNVMGGVELICEGTAGAGIEGSPRLSMKNRYFGDVTLSDAATSLIVKGGGGKAWEALNSFHTGDATLHPEGLTPTVPDLTTDGWVHATQTGLPIDATNFPDEAFRTHVAQYDVHADGFLSRYELSLVTEMNLFQKGIADMTGIGHFTSLVSLNCGANNFAAIDLAPLTKLTSFECYASGLQSIDLSTQTRLVKLDLRNNRLAKLDVRHNTRLTELQCENNFVDSLDVSMCPALQTLNCGATYPTRALKWLNVAGCAALEALDCKSGLLEELDVSECTSLQRLLCYYNNLALLNVAGLSQLTFLSCDHNALTSLQTEGCTSLNILNCSNNPQLAELNVSGNNIETLECSGCGALAEVRCQMNHLEGEKMDQFIASLPAKTEAGATLYLVDEDHGDGNVCTTAQLSALIAKGWLALRYKDGAWSPIEPGDDFVAELTIDGLRYKCAVATNEAELCGVANPTIATANIPAQISGTINGTAFTFAVTALADQAFEGCTSLATVVIPASVTQLGHEAFAQTEGLKLLIMRGTTPPQVATDTFGEAALGATLVVPVGARAVYRPHSPWKLFAQALEVGDANLDGATSITDVGLMIDHILGSTPAGYEPLVADVNADGQVSITDVGLVIDIILSPGGGFYGSDDEEEIIVSPIGDDSGDDNRVRRRRF